MKFFLRLLILLCLLPNLLWADDTLSKQKELETKIKLLEKELEIEKLKKELAEQKKANKKQKENNPTETFKKKKHN
jgi:hypothetical protein